MVELLHWLRDQPSSAAPAWHALQRALEAQDDSPDEMLRLEHQREAAEQLAIGNVITSMRLLSSLDWPLFFEHVSLVERILRGDPAGAYARDGLRDARSLPPFGRTTRHAAPRPEPDVAPPRVALAAARSAHDPQTIAPITSATT